MPVGCRRGLTADQGCLRIRRMAGPKIHRPIHQLASLGRRTIGRRTTGHIASHRRTSSCRLANRSRPANHTILLPARHSLLSIGLANLRFGVLRLEIPVDEMHLVLLEKVHLWRGIHGRDLWL